MSHPKEVNPVIHINSNPAKSSQAMKLAATFTLASISVGVIFIFWSGVSFAQPYGLISVGAGVGIFFLLLPKLIRLARDEHQSRLSAKTARIVSTITTAVIGLFVIGFLQDLVGMHCDGIMGAATTCLASWTLWISLLLFSPYILVSVLIILGTIQWLDHKKPKRS